MKDEHCIAIIAAIYEMANLSRESHYVIPRGDEVRLAGELLARVRRTIVENPPTACFATAPSGGTFPWMCTLPHGHRGAHVATTFTGQPAHEWGESK